ncbi:MAG: hypothetical protein J6X52_03025 [Clostridia bacterium]|nr:hypothetical protein [Clostridia bacterium]
MKKLVSLALVTVLLFACVMTVSAGEQEEIVDAAFALAAGQSLSGSKTLTGVVKAIVTAYNSEYKNVTVNITVKNSVGEDKVIQCYRMEGADAATVGIGDTITVTGTIKNYYGTIEFDAGCTFVTIAKGEEQKPPETEEEILAAAFALDVNTALPGTYSLTGIVTSKADSNQVHFTVGGKDILCYRMNSENYAEIGVGDKITVTGSIKNYNGTVEFDSGNTAVIVEKAQSEESSGEESSEPASQPEDETEADIVDAAFALGKGESLNGTKTLTGVVSGMVNPYNETEKDVSVNMKVKGNDGAEKIIQCYLMKGEDAATVGINDTIKVTGTIKNYNGTVEFDKGATFVTVKKGTPPAQPKTEQEILTAAFALPKGEILPGTYTLTGTVTEKLEKDNQVKMTVAGKEILCFKMEAQSYGEVGKGDKIAVTGVLKNYNGTIEFISGCTAQIIEKADPSEVSEPETSETSAQKPTTEKEILAAAFALAEGEELEGTYSLTGKVTEIVEKYQDKFGNVTVLFEVGGKTVKAYRVVGDDAPDIEVGDKIKVTGRILNYQGTVEFDKDSAVVIVKKNTPASGDSGIAVFAVVAVLALAGAVAVKKAK